MVVFTKQRSNLAKILADLAFPLQEARSIAVFMIWVAMSLKSLVSLGLEVGQEAFNSDFCLMVSAYFYLKQKIDH